MACGLKASSCDPLSGNFMHFADLTILACFHIPYFQYLYTDLHTSIYLREYYLPNLKLACFMYYLKIIKTFLKNNICNLKQIVQVTQNGIEILVGKQFLSYGSKQSINCFDQSIT